MDVRCRVRGAGACCSRLAISAAFAWLAALPDASLGQVFTIDSDAGTIDGMSTGVLNGTSFEFLPLGQGTTSTIAGFRFLGDLTLEDGQTLKGVGNRGVSLLVGNDVLVAPGAIIDFAASGSTPGAGGGAGGQGNQGGPGGPGSLVVDQGRADGGAGGTGGVPGLFGGEGFFGAAARDGDGGNPAVSFMYSSNPGGDGVNAPGSGGYVGAPINRLGGSAGPGGVGGNNGYFFPTFRGGAGGSGGNGNGGTGGNGEDGGSGQSGGVGGEGGGGERGYGGTNFSSDLTINGGGGGSSGSPGSGGGGGGQGGYGAGGGGGGGGGGKFGPGIFDISFGGSGGTGGSGGIGGAGGNGGQGGTGGYGGGGGGAIELIARGSIFIQGEASVAGGDASDGPEGLLGQPGGTPSGGVVGESGNTGDTLGGIGGRGGNGGNGGAGGNGGRGGAGGQGGSGAGGTLKMIGSTTSVLSGRVSTEAGDGAPDGSLFGGFRHPGRLILGNNTGVGYDGDGNPRVTSTIGPRAPNPYAVGMPSTPLIPGLIGGAEAFGLLDPALLDPTELDAIAGGLPAGLSGAIVQYDIGPAGYAHDFPGFDMLVLYNLAEEPAAPDLQLGVSDDVDSIVDSFQLLTGGFANEPAFGGAGPVALGSLAPGAAFATLIPESTERFNVTSTRGLETAQTTAFISDDETVYLSLLLSDVLGGDFNSDYKVDGVDLSIWETYYGTPNPLGSPVHEFGDADEDGDIDGSDFLAWQREFGYGLAAPASSTNVPEPAAWLMLMLGMAVMMLTGGRTFVSKFINA